MKDVSRRNAADEDSLANGEKDGKSFFRWKKLCPYGRMRQNAGSENETEEDDFVLEDGTEAGFALFFQNFSTLFYLSLGAEPTVAGAINGTDEERPDKELRPLRFLQN